MADAVDQSMPHFPQWHIMLADEGGLLVWMGGPFDTQREAVAYIDKLNKESRLGGRTWFEAQAARTQEEAMALLPQPGPDEDDEFIGDPTRLDPWSLGMDDLHDAMRDFCIINGVDEYGDFLRPLNDHDAMWWTDASAAASCFEEGNDY